MKVFLLAIPPSLFTLERNGVLPLFGPLPEEGTLSGICIFAVKTRAEAGTLLQDDPRIASGRISFDIYPWCRLKGDSPLIAGAKDGPSPRPDGPFLHLIEMCN